MKTVFLIFCMLIFFNCGSPSDDTDPPEDGFGSVSGIVVDSIGGSAVGGSIAVIEDLPEFSAITDENGFFRIDDVPAGYHTILVQKSGMAGSRLQNVYIWDGEITNTEIVQPVYDFSSSLTTPPVISVNGIETSETYSDEVPINITAEQGSFPVMSTSCHEAIYIKIGSYTGLLYDASSSGSSLSYTWNTEDYSSNIVNIKIVSYDINNNRSEINIPVYVAGEDGNLPSVKPISIHYYIAAITYGNSLNMFRSMLNRHPEISLNLPEEIVNSSMDMGKASEMDSSVIVYANVRAIQDTTGICVYRSNEESTGYVTAGKTSYIYNPESENKNYRLIDCSSEISPGTVWYRIRYFNEHGMGPLSDPIEVAILPKYNLFLTYPEDNSVITEADPTLRWEANVIPGATRYDSVFVWNYSTGETHVNWKGIEDGPNEFPIFPLPANCIYAWNVCSHYVIDKNSVRSYSVPAQDDYYDTSTNGAFIFTVIERPAQ